MSQVILFSCFRCVVIFLLLVGDSQAGPDRAAGFVVLLFLADAVGAHGISSARECGDESCAGCCDEQQEPDRARALLVAYDGAGYPARGGNGGYEQGG
jgi:hypothetical protein